MAAYFIREIVLFGALFVESVGLNAPPGGDAKTGLSVLLILMFIFLAIFLLIGIVLIYKFTIGKKRQTTLKEDYRREAEECEKAGKFVSAAAIYENNLKNQRKAAELYEKGGDYRQAALLYDLIGLPARAKEMYQKAGDIESAAEVSVLEGDYEDAAKLYHSSGKKIDAAMMLEKAGRKMAAVRIYREAGDYRKAAQLMEEEGLLRESAEMFGISLRDKQIGDCVDDFYTYALKLERAGDKEMAVDVFREIDGIDPGYRDVKERLERLAPTPVEEDLGSRTALRSFIRSGRIEPKHAIKLWIHILRALQEAYKIGKPYGSLSPDSIAVDAHNKISFPFRRASSAYAAPESTKGSKPDACSDVYSAGVILYEMLMGDLDGLGSTRIIDKIEDVPDWLDEIVIKCLRKVREDRYPGIDLILEDIKAISEKKKAPAKAE